MISIVEVDFNNPIHTAALVKLMDEYACDPMGGGESLPEKVKTDLPRKLAGIETAICLLAFDGDYPVGLLNAFQGFSTFAAKPLINIHDVIVSKDWRRKGVSHLMIRRLEVIAVDRDCCKLTLEVLSENTVAQASYSKIGFQAYRLSEKTGVAEFWQKPLNPQKNL